MPRQHNYYEPDGIDCDALSSAIRQDFGGNPHITLDFLLDQVVVICKVVSPARTDVNEVMVQAKVTSPLKARKSCFTLVYSVLLDCWHQLDRGVLGAATRPIDRGWNGRPQRVRRTDK